MIRGMMPAIVTPSKDGSYRPDVMEEYISWLLEQDINGLFALGTTGEGLLLSMNDWDDAVRDILRFTAGKVPVIVQCGAIRVEDTMVKIASAIDAGADAMAVLTPFFYQQSDESIERYYAEILSSWPNSQFCLYNIPKYSNNAVAPAVYKRLSAQFPNLRGIKDSSGSVDSLKAFVEAVPDNAVYSGSDKGIQAAAQLGVKGVVSGVGAALPIVVSDAWQKAIVGDYSGAELMKEITDVFHKVGTIASARALLMVQGMDVGYTFYGYQNKVENLGDRMLRDLKTLGVQLREPH